MNEKCLIYQGAEAKITKTEYLSHPAVKKKRVKKGYRIKEIDDLLIQSRTKEEAKIMGLARNNGVYVPIIYDVDLNEGSIIFEFLNGDRVKDIFDELPDEKRKHLCIQIGQQIGLLHNAEIVHGDITTSNMILVGDHVYFIDFGLSEINAEIEARGVDLHLLMEAIESTHSTYSSFFSYVLNGYKKTYKDNFKMVKQKIDDIIKRGRYR